MKATRIARAIALAGVAAVTVAGVQAIVAPANAVRNTVVVVESNAPTSLNSAKPDTNLTVNADIGYLTGQGFNYYDDNKNLVKDTNFGTYSIVKNVANDFEVKYTVKSDQKWSDNTPVDGVDMLLSYALASSDYSKAAGLGDPQDPNGCTDCFQSLGYGGPFDNHIKGITLSADKKSVTIKYDSFQPDWEIQFGVGFPAHGLYKVAYPNFNGSNAAAKAAVLDAFNNKTTGVWKKLADAWNTAYDITAINNNTNPDLLISNGAYVVQSGVTGQSITLVANPNYTGDHPAGINKIVLKVLDDTTAAAQAMSNGEIDVFQGQATADAVNTLKSTPGINVISGVSACYEHVDLRSDAAYGTTDKYNGVFAGSTKGKALRKAFLLAYPRDEIVAKLVKPVRPAATTVNSLFTLPGQTGYDSIVAGSGVSTYTAGTQASRTAAALKIVQSYYPKASATNAVVPISLLWGKPSNTRRAAEAQLVIAAEKKAGFNVTSPGLSAWGGNLDNSAYDAAFFAWCPTSVSQMGTNANFQSDGANNYTGYANAALDKILHSLEVKLPSDQITAKYLAAEKILMADAVSLPIFQHPAVTAVSSALKGVKPAPLSPNLVWNYWEWHY